jgi:UDP-N-acetylglucosamine 2-epimerase (non-hydrolysing)/GDP/UDP-N,N'-diacetylbacillosamine 2-epimerase (hydrolysing)
MKKKITVVTGTRADYGLLKPILKKIISSKNLELHLIVTGMHLSQKYGMTINEIKKDGFKINSSFKMINNSDSQFSMSASLGKSIVSFSKIFKKIKPDLNMILGDRNEMLASSIAASHMNIPNVHIHGGDISGGIDEYNRHAITKLSNIHFAASQKSKNRLIHMGENPNFVFFSGSPAIDDIVIHKYSKKILEKKFNIKFSKKVILLVYHPYTTNLIDTKNHILKTLNAISKFKIQTIIIAPNSDAGNKMIFKLIHTFSKKFTFIKMYRSLPRSDYVALLKNCSVLVGNSSSGLIEASFINIPVVDIGNRQKNRERGKNVVHVDGKTSKETYIAINNLLKKNSSPHTPSLIYGNGSASKIIIKYLEKLKITPSLIEKQISF